MKDISKSLTDFQHIFEAENMKNSTKLNYTSNPNLKVDTTEGKATDLSSPNYMNYDENKIIIPETNQKLDFKCLEVEEIFQLLKKTCLNASQAARNLNDDGKFYKTLIEVKDSFLVRAKEIKSFRNNERDDNINDLNQRLFDLHRVCWNLNNKLVKISAQRSPLGQSTKILLNKKKLVAFANEIHEAWISLMLQLAMMLADKSTKDATDASVHVAQLAIATGSPDWKDISLDDAGKLYTQGDKFLFGYGFPQSYDLAYKRYQAAANAGFPEAFNMLGMMHENGLGQKRDMNLALQNYREAASKNCLDALNNLGRIYQNGLGCSVDYGTAQEYYTKAAEGGHLDAMVNIGYLLEHGLGSSANSEASFHWYNTAAEKGYAKAENAVGSCYYKGLVSLKKNPEEAVKWFRKSSLQGNSHAMNNLGICYEEGLGVSKDLGIAKQYYKESALLMHPSATNNYGYMLLLEHDYDEAIKNFHMSMHLGSAEGAFNLGNLYENGCYHYSELILSTDLDMAIKYYKIAAKKNHVQAQIRLGIIYLTGPQQIQSPEIALQYLTPAAEEGDNGDAQNLIGQMKELGLVGSNYQEQPGLGGSLNSLKSSNNTLFQPDYKSSKVWYQKALLKGHLGAMYNMGSLYEQGNGVERDIEKAALYFQMGARGGHKESTLKIEEYKTLRILE
ncbi:hypothetical protein HDU92_008207 [Lobulomyces angularis]|nr:hypothetical protein HDU92_008207 [Lobulomyces angularis]